MSPTRLGILVFAVAVALGPLYTVAGYSPASNLISELAAQQTRGSEYMVAGFLALGGGVLADARGGWRGQRAAFGLFGLCMALAGLVGHKPITPGVPFDELLHQAHGLLGTLSGISITVGFAWQAWREKVPAARGVAALLAVLALALPLAMLAVPAWQGLIQRVMYAAFLAWLWLRYPGRVA